MAGSANAFARSRKDQPSAFNVLVERDRNAGAPKRPRLSEDAIASIHIQHAQSDTALEVDHMILDFTAYQAIKACFASRARQSVSSQSLSNSLSMLDTLWLTFKARHPAYTADAELCLRILLLKLVTLITQRLTSNPTTPTRADLQDLRAANKQRSVSWIGSAGRIPSSPFDMAAFEHLNIPQQELERNRAHVLHQFDIPAEDEDYEDAFYGTASSVSLLDTIPTFMSVSAACNAMYNIDPTPRWMQLACGLMLQACLEQYLVFGAEGTDAVDEAFAWGCRQMGNDDMDVREEGEQITKNPREVYEMFEDEERACEVEGWSDMKASYLMQLFPTARNSPTSASPTRGPGDIGGKNVEVICHLEMVATKHPISAFETVLLEFLEDLSNSIPKPLLAQLEDGKLDGLSERETKNFLAECLIDPATLLGPTI